MRCVLINHHLYQEGDTYGLIYSLLLSQSLEIGDPMYALYYVNHEDYKKNTDRYKDKVNRRLQYFSSFGLLEKRVILVLCSYSNDVPLFRVSEPKQAPPPELGCRYIHLWANETLFKDNPRRISLVLTGKENDPSNTRDAITNQLPVAPSAESSLPGQLREFKTLLARMLQANGSGSDTVTEADVDFAYISKSTEYVLRCVREAGFVKVTQLLRNAIWASTPTVDVDNISAYLKEFIETLDKKYVEKANKSPSGPQLSGRVDEDMAAAIIVLFWIRGAKNDETEAILGKSGNVGKPQHHTNLTLYKYVRETVRSVAQNVNRPFLFVPIGDALTESVDEEEGYAKTKKDYNLINFFDDAPFKGKPMGLQMEFLLDLSTSCQVIQMGMRSGAMERLMYLGVPTIYFDRREQVKGLPNPVGATRIHDLCGFQPDKSDDKQNALLSYLTQLDGYFESRDKRYCPNGFPLFFHIENRDTGFLRYSSVGGSRVNATVGKLLGTLSSQYKEHKRSLMDQGAMRRAIAATEQRLLLDVGALTQDETAKLELILWFIATVYPEYSRCYGKNGEAPARTPNKYSSRLEEYKEGLLETEAAKRRARSAKPDAAQSIWTSAEPFFTLFEDS